MERSVSDSQLLTICELDSRPGPRREGAACTGCEQEPMASSWCRGRRDGRVSDLFGLVRPVRRSIEYSPRFPESRAATYVSGGRAERPDGNPFQPSAQRLAYCNSAEVL